MPRKNDPADVEKVHYTLLRVLSRMPNDAEFANSKTLGYPIPKTIYDLYGSSTNADLTSEAEFPSLGAAPKAKSHKIASASVKKLGPLAIKYRFLPSFMKHLPGGEQKEEEKEEFKVDKDSEGRPPQVVLLTLMRAADTMLVGGRVPKAGPSADNIIGEINPNGYFVDDISERDMQSKFKNNLNVYTFKYKYAQQHSILFGVQHDENANVIYMSFFHNGPSGISRLKSDWSK